MIQTVLAMHNDKIRSIVISGHSGSADKGEDLICAAVSAIAFGTCNALDLLGSDAKCTIGDNRIEIRTVTEDETTAVILNTMRIQLETVQEGNETFVTIRKTEV